MQTQMEGTARVKSVTRMAEQSKKQLLIGLLFLTVGGCTYPAKKPTMPVWVPGSFSTTGTERLQDQWWRAFGDHELDGLIDAALTANFDLRTVWDRLAQTQALARRTDASLWPQANLTAEVSRTRQEANGAVN
jgi:outer membrane protein TolC